MFSDIGLGYSDFSNNVNSSRSSIDKQAQIIEYLKVYIFKYNVLYI